MWTLLKPATPIPRGQSPALLLALLGCLSTWQSHGAMAGEAAPIGIEALLDQLEDPHTGKLNREAYSKLFAAGLDPLPALAKRLKRPDCSAYAAVAAMEIAPQKGLDILLEASRRADGGSPSAMPGVSSTSWVVAAMATGSSSTATAAASSTSAALAAWR